jgi:hypothetical protein
MGSKVLVGVRACWSPAMVKEQIEATVKIM